MEIKDSGNRRAFNTGAVRDIAQGKGRCDLLPIDIIAPLMPEQELANILYHIGEFIATGYNEHLYKALILFGQKKEWQIGQLIMEASKQYEDGALKYGEHNWEKGIPLHSYIDSAIRHFLKFVDGWTDEPHDRAFVWNILSAIWTQAHLPDMIDMSFPDRVNRSHADDDRCDADPQSR